MKRKIDMLAATWKADKLWGTLSLCWLATVCSSFFGPHLFRVTLPALGSMYLFRFLLPVTALLYILWAVRERENPWKGASAVEKWVYVLMGIMLLYGAVSLCWAIDFRFSFNRLFNLCLDFCFFFLMLRLCKDKRLFRSTLCMSVAMMLILALIGVYEAFNGHIFPIVYTTTDYYGSRTFAYLLGLPCRIPVVTFAGPNDFAAMLLFVAAAAFLLWANDPEPRTRRKLWGVILAFTLIYFLIEVTGTRLCKLAFFLLFAGVLIWFFCQDRRLRWVPVVMLLLVLCVELSFTYYIERPSSAAPPSVRPLPEDKDFLALEKDFFTSDPETGEIALQLDVSTGIRLRLLLHAFDCFRESYGLGVGLGNTETLSAMRITVPRWENPTQHSIHCFIARIAADYGLFVVIPLCAIGFLLLKQVYDLFTSAVREKDRSSAGFSLLFLFVLLVYPFTSSSSSDSQDFFSMWIYLASLVLCSARLKSEHEENKALHE